MRKKCYSLEERECLKSRIISDAALLEKGAEISESGGILTTDEQENKFRTEMMWNLQKDRLARYISNLETEIAQMDPIGEEAKKLEMVMGNEKEMFERFRIWGLSSGVDARLIDNQWHLFPDVTYLNEAFKGMRDYQASKVFPQEIAERELMHQETVKRSWQPVLFKERVESFFSKKGDQIRDHQQEKIALLAKHLLTRKVPVASYKPPMVEEVSDYCVGESANNTAKITEQDLDVLEFLLGEPVPRERIVTIQWAYDPTGKLGAIVMILKGDQAFYDKIHGLKREEWEKERMTALSQNPLLLLGALIIKTDGKRMFLPRITWKQYPTISSSGRFVMTFEAGKGRGIFDEDVFFWGEMPTSTGDKIFFDGSEGSDVDGYEWRNGAIVRRNGQTYQLRQRRSS